MKKLIIIFVFSLLLFSCRKPNNTQVPKSMNNVVVPVDFSWESTKTIYIIIKSDFSSIIKIESADETTVYEKGFFNASDTTYNVELDIASYEEFVFLNGVKLDIPDNNVLIINLVELNAIYRKSTKLVNPISLWHFDEGSGTIVNDSEGSNNGILSNGTWVDGVYNSAILFNGQTSNISIPNADNLNPSEQVTIMAWAKSQENKTSKIAQKGDWDGFGLGFDKWNGWFGHISLQGGGSMSLKWGARLPLMNEWYHLAMTYDGQEIKLYVNGILKNSESISGQIRINGRPFSIGSDNADQKFFSGSIDEVVVYGTALSDQEILSYYQGQNNSDADGDGIPDEDDDYPDDNSRAFNNYWPNNNNGTILFEDLWPGKGDYDFNDIVIDFRINRVCNANNKVVEVLYNFKLMAIGAGMPNGFGFQINNDKVFAEDLTVSGYSLLSNYINLEANGLESEQSKPTIIVFDDANLVMPSPTGFGVNVEIDKPYVEPVVFNIVLEVEQDKYNKGKFKTRFFNPFIIVNKERGKEIHLADFPPTDLMDTSLFGSNEDDSDPVQGKYYKTSNNLPWALLLPKVTEHPLENVQMTAAYLKFYDWASSGGNEYKNWFRKNNSEYRDNSNIYYPPSK